MNLTDQADLINHNAIVDIRLEDFPGGVGMWGAVPASYDTTRLPMDRGIHVHARAIPGKQKAIDKTYRAVRILSNQLPMAELVVSELEAIYYMVSTIFGIQPENVLCPKCSASHFDQDWFSVHPHRVHRCQDCGETFESLEPLVGNPITTVKESCGVPPQKVFPSTKKLDIKQSHFQNGLLIWGSNPAFLWTGDQSEQEGMHVHLFGDSSNVTELDETYGTVRIDDIEVDAQMVRLLMAQESLPMLRGQISLVICPSCSGAQFDTGSAAFTPSATRRCANCSYVFESAQVVSNPALAVFKKLEGFAIRGTQHFVLNLPSSRPAA